MEAPQPRVKVGLIPGMSDGRSGPKYPTHKAWQLWQPWQPAPQGNGSALHPSPPADFPQPSLAHNSLKPECYSVYVPMRPAT